MAGRYVFEPAIFDYIRQTPPGRNSELQISDSVRLMLRNGLAVAGVSLESDEQRLDIGNYASYFRAFLELALKDDELGLDFRDYARRRIGEA